MTALLRTSLPLSAFNAIFRYRTIASGLAARSPFKSDSSGLARRSPFVGPSRRGNSDLRHPSHVATIATTVIAITIVATGPRTCSGTGRVMPPGSSSETPVIRPGSMI